MNDKKDEMIIKLFELRDEEAIKETDKKYRGFCMSLLSNLLNHKEDREECLSDAFLRLWNTIPPEKPQSLSAYLAAIVRNFALQRSRAENAWKRGGRVMTVGDEFLADITDGRTLADDYESTLAGKILNEFLDSQPIKHRRIFIMRYWLDDDISKIAAQMGRSESSIASLLKRMRDKLRKQLQKEGIIYE